MIDKKTGVFEPHILAHEFAHRKSYLKELEVQLLSYLALKYSNKPVLKQSAHCERLRCQIVEAREARKKLNLPPLDKKPSLYEKVVSTIMKPAYILKMKLTGQEFSDYTKGFTNFLYTIKEPVS